MTNCPCGSNIEIDSCCGPLLSGEKQAATAEELMRSRYTAYATGNIEYIRKSTYRGSVGDFDEEGARKWSQDSKWMGLEILSTEEGREEDSQGKVEFKAIYAQNDEEYEHHEIAEFRKDGGRWSFVDGKIVNSTTFVRETPKVGRNDPCPCGSGKKYKKCCGKAG